MRITTLLGENIQGQTFRHELAPVTVFAGPNWSGKTSRVRALWLALAGYCPDLRTATGGPVLDGKELYRLLASGPEMKASVHYDNPSTVNFTARHWTAKGAGPIAGITPLVKAAELDAGEYLGLSDRERVKALFGMAAKVSKDLDPMAVAKAIRTALSKVTCDPHTRFHVTAVARAVAKVPEADFHDVAALVEQVAQSMAEWKKAANEQAKRMKGAVQGVAQVGGEVPPADAEQRWEAASLALVTANEKVAKAKALYNAASEKCHELQALAGMTLAAERPKVCPECGRRMVAAKVKAGVRKKALADHRKAVQEHEAAKVAKEDAHAAYTAAVNALGTAQVALQQAHAQYKALLAYRAEQGVRARAAEEGDQARAEWEVAKQCEEAVLRFKEKVLEQAVGPLLERANRLCEPILRAPLVWVDGELGMVVEKEQFVSHRTFSGVERLLSHAALSVALASMGGGPLRLVVLDEFGRLQPSRKDDVVMLLRQLVLDDHIDQAILVDAVDSTVGTIYDLANDSGLMKVVHLEEAP